MLGSVVRVAEACRDAALRLKTPFISGKDSLNNEFRTQTGVVKIPMTFAAVPSKFGTRVSVLTGFVLRK